MKDVGLGLLFYAIQLVLFLWLREDNYSDASRENAVQISPDLQLHTKLIRESRCPKTLDTQHPQILNPKPLSAQNTHTRDPCAAEQHSSLQYALGHRRHAGREGTGTNTSGAVSGLCETLRFAAFVLQTLRFRVTGFR